ncbi:hypothetical protein AG1IA_00088 [Rhizoctonia solani AG-1 IA]|uniref:Uncharacterized protein n=1 Tax=Thanatephorus cucumeris (strain AG1-IA) TaxID=983506 RepID=L8X6Q8_THACA|nr:hypothetical protein AG1IA_00088 [Rhizoctonia solani AG-1 IA]
MAGPPRPIRRAKRCVALPARTSWTAQQLNEVANVNAEKSISNDEDEQAKSKGYGTIVDPSGRLYARFPPHRPEEPDYGFLFGIKNLYSTLCAIWNEERAKRHKLAQRSSIDQLPALSTEGKQIFDEIFGTSHRSGDTNIDLGMLST